MSSPSSGPSGLDAAVLAARRGWFGVLYLLSRESKASTAAFVVTILSDLIQFSVFPIISVTILDVDTLFALADAGSSSGRAILFWVALAIVMVFLGMLFYVIGTLLTEGRQQAIVLRLLGSMASILTTVAFMPAASLLLSIFHGCNSVNALGVQCQQDGHWVVMTLVVLVLTVFTAVSTFFASVYIDTDLTSTAWGARVTGRVDAAMLVIKLVLVTCFTAVSLPPAVQAVLAGAGALVWLAGTVFVQPYVQPTANSLAAAAACLNTWLVIVVVFLLAAPETSASALVFVGLVIAPVLGFLANSAYRTAVVASDFSALRSALQADIWARGRVALAQSLASTTGRPTSSLKAAGHGRYGQQGAHGRGARTVSADGSGPAQPGAAARSFRPTRRSGLATVHSAAMMPAGSGVLGPALGEKLKVQILADGGEPESESRPAEPVTTSRLLPGITMESLLSQAGMAYDEMLKTWPKAAVTYASGSIFHRAYGSTVSSELTILAMARKQVGGAWDVAFLSYQRTRQLQERTGSGLSAVDRILFEEAWSAAVEDAIKCFALQNRLYGTAVESIPDAGTMGTITSQLYTARTTAEQRFRTMLSINPESIMALRAYSCFCDEVLGDPDRAAELRNKASRIEEKHAKTNVRSLETIAVGAPDEALSVMDEMNAVVTMTGDLRRYGEITDVNLAGARLFGRARCDLIGQSVSALFPEPLGLYYDAAILSYLSPHDQNEAFARGTHVSIIQTTGGWLAAARVSLQEGAGSELDATPCLSMVVQRAPTKRRMLVVGDAEAGFPVLAMDAESMALLGDVGDDADDEGPFDGENDAGGSVSPAVDDPAAGAGVRAGLLSPGRQQGWSGGAGTGGSLVARELPLIRWVPDIGRLAAAAMASASGAQADLRVQDTMYNADDVSAYGDDGTEAAAAVAPHSSVSDADTASVDRTAGRGAMGIQAPARRGPRAVKLRFSAQALHRDVLGGRRPGRGREPTHWLVTWEAPRQRHADARALFTRAATRGRSAGKRPSNTSSAGKSPTHRRSVSTSRRRGSQLGSVRAVAAAACEPDAKVRPETGVSLESGGSLAVGPQSRDDALLTGQCLSSRQQGHSRDVSDGQLVPQLNHGGGLEGRAGGGPGDGAGSMASATTTAQGLTRKIVDAALSKPDPMVRGIALIVVASLAAVMVFSCALAVAVPIMNDNSEQLLMANDMAQRRSYNAEVSMGKWYQLISVGLGFTVVDDWDTLVSNLTSSVDRYEGAHRTLLAVSQRIRGDLNAFEQQRGWDVCTSSSELYVCDGYEKMSASDFIEFTIFHLRQLASLPTNGIVVRDPANPRVVVGYHKSLYILVPNIDLIGLALDQARDISARELSEGLSAKLSTMTAVLVTVAVATFTVATLGTTFLVAKLGSLRRRILISLAQVPRRMLKAMAQQTEHAQAAFATAIGADSGDDDAIMQDVDGTPRGGSTRDLFKAALPGKVQTAAVGMSARVVRLTGGSSGSSAQFEKVCFCCRRRKRPSKRRVTDSSCFVLNASVNITAPLALTAFWVAIILVLVNNMFEGVVIDAARSEQLQNYAGATSALRGQIEVTLLLPGERRSVAMEEARTNSTAVLQALGAVLNGAESTVFGARLPGLAESSQGVPSGLFDILVHDSCKALPASSWEHGLCSSLHEQYGLKGLHSFTTAMLADGVEARAIFNESKLDDDRDLPALLGSGAVFEIIPAMQRYNVKSGMGEILLQSIVNMSADSARQQFASTWSQIQLVIGVFTGGFVLVIWLWALPAIRRLVEVRASLLTLLRSLPEQAVLVTPAVSSVLVLIATISGMAQAGRAMQSVVKTADQRSRAMYRAAASAPDPRFAKHSGPAAAAVVADAVGVYSSDSDVWAGAEAAASGGRTPDPSSDRGARGHSKQNSSVVLQESVTTEAIAAAAMQSE